jgi:hypothetical protein
MNDVTKTWNKGTTIPPPLPRLFVPRHTTYQVRVHCPLISQILTQLDCLWPYRTRSYSLFVTLQYKILLSVCDLTEQDLTLCLWPYRTRSYSLFVTLQNKILLSVCDLTEQDLTLCFLFCDWYTGSYIRVFILASMLFSFVWNNISWLWSSSGQYFLAAFFSSTTSMREL